MFKRVLCLACLGATSLTGHAFTYADAGALVDGAVDYVRTETPGQTVQASGTSQQTYTTLDGAVRVISSVSTTVAASASVGVNRLGSGGAYAYTAPPSNAISGSGGAVMNGSTYSRWYDTLRVTHQNGSSQDPVSLTFRGVTYFDLSESTPYFIGPSSTGLDGAPLSARQSLFIQGADVVTWTMADFVANRTVGRIEWSYTWDWYTNVDLLVGVTFSASSAAGVAFQLDPACRVGCQGQGAFSSYNTTLLERIEVNGGAGLISESGELVAKDGYYTFQAVLDHTPAVPEPSTYALFATGAAVLVYLRRRARRAGGALAHRGLQSP